MFSCKMTFIKILTFLVGESETRFLFEITFGIKILYLKKVFFFFFLTWFCCLKGTRKCDFIEVASFFSTFWGIIMAD